MLAPRQRVAGDAVRAVPHLHPAGLLAHPHRLAGIDPRHRVSAPPPVHNSVARHLPQLLAGIRIGRPPVDRLECEPVPPAGYHRFVRRPVHPLVGHFPNPLAQPDVQIPACARFAPSSPHRKFRHTYFTPDSTLPFVWARPEGRPGRHSRGAKPQ